MSVSNIKLTFTAGFILDRTLNLDIVVNDLVVYSNHNANQNKFTVEFDSPLPAEILFKLSGKNQDFDTVLDDQGNITADKFIRLDELIIDRMRIKRYHLENKLIKFITENNEQHTTNYFGFNGTAKLSIPFSNSLDFHLSLLQVSE